MSSISTIDVAIALAVLFIIALTPAHLAVTITAVIGVVVISAMALALLTFLTYFIRSSISAGIKSK